MQQSKAEISGMTSLNVAGFCEVDLGEYYVSTADVFFLGAAAYVALPYRKALQAL